MNDFKDRYRKAVSQQRAAQRLRRGKKRDKWAGHYLGMQVDRSTDEDSRESEDDESHPD